MKVLQSLYAFYQSHEHDLAAGEKQLFFGIEKIYDLYIYQLSLLAELLVQEERTMEDNLLKRLPTHEDLHPKRAFLENKCLVKIAGDVRLQKLASQKRISWSNDRDLVRKLLARIRQQPYYWEYLETTQHDLGEDTRFVLKMFKRDILPFELLHHFYEEKSIYWLDDWELVNKMIIKTLKLSVEAGGQLQLMKLFKEEDDRRFALELFRKTILNHDHFDRIISAKTKNWDIERIAIMDIIIMEMALSEILKFPEIPVKVSLNEYIELSKMYSTPKSKVFVNGVLDKLVEEFVRDGKIGAHETGFSAPASE